MQGFNMGRYVPPESEGLVSANALHRKHALGSRASKLSSQGILTVRFEMPFAVWCAHCPRPTIIGQGVRFNAHKKRVGSYHSTPIWSFVIHHADCGGEIEIRTDPKNTEYVVVRGGRRRDMPSGGDDDLVKTGGVVVLTDRERAEERETAFGKLEKTIADRERLVDATVRIGELVEVSGKLWEDPYAQNQRLRKAFRVGRREREREAGRDEDLKERMGLDIELLPGTEEDVLRAGLVEFGGVDVDTDKSAERALARPLFGGIEKQGGRDGGRKRLKAEIAADRTRQSLVDEIVGNTRAAKDPFLGFGESRASKGPVRIAGLKRKRVLEEAPGPPAPSAIEPAVTNDAELGNESKEMAEVKDTAASKLVSYDSDSE